MGRSTFLLAVSAVCLSLSGCSDLFWDILKTPVPRKPASRVRSNTAKVRSNSACWKYAQAEINANQAKLDALEEKIKDRGLYKYVLRNGDEDRKEISLTFDDGPHPGYTLKLLDILKKEDVKATFFVIGHMAEQHPELVKKIAADGHEVANHTYSHVTLTKITPEEAETEYKANNDVIRRLVGKRARYCRPPGGDFNSDVLKAAAVLNLTTVLWTDDPGDYDNPKPKFLLRKELSRLSPGGIILLHDGSKSTLATLVQFIEEARKQGYTFVTLDELRQNRVAEKARPK